MPDRSRHRNHRRGPSYILPPAGSAREGDADIHICPRCRSELVQPVEWAAVDRCRWRVELRCPECTHHSIDTYAQRVLARFEAHLEQATEALLTDLAALERENAEQEIAAFADAIARNLVLPEDF